MGHHRRTLEKAHPPKPPGDRWIVLVLTHHRLVLALAFVLTVLAGFESSRLQLDSDLRSLLPQDNPVVQDLERIEAAFGVLGSIQVVVQGGTPEARRAFAEALDAGLEGHPLLTEVDHRPERGFFVDHALYYLPESDFAELSRRVQAVEHHALCSHAPDVCVGQPDARAPEALRTFVSEKRRQAEERIGVGEYYERPGIEALVVFLRPTRPANDLTFDQSITAEMRTRVAAIQAQTGPWTGTDLRFNLVGSYVAKGEERRVVPQDMIRSGLVGFLGVVTILFLLFRSFRAVITLLVPLLAGLAWSMGATQVVLGHLNTMTSLISSVILGMGIDAGIHLLGRVQREGPEREPREAIRSAFQALFVPLLVASTTTIGAFAIMTTSDFPAFQEFGLIGALGVLLCLVAMLAVFPALLLAVGIPPAPRFRSPSPMALARFLLVRPGLTGLVVAVVTTVAGFGLAATLEHGFEPNGRLLGSHRVRASQEPDEALLRAILGKDIHPSIALVPSYQALQRDFARAREQHAARVRAGDTRVADLVSAVSLLPPPEIDLEARHQAIQELTESFSDRTWARIEGRDPDATEEPRGNARKDAPLGQEEARILRRMLSAGPFSVDDLPAPLTSRIRTPQGQWGMFAYPNFDRGHFLHGVELMEETAQYGPTGNPWVGEDTVFAAMYLTTLRAWPQVLGITSVAVLGLVLFQLRRLSHTVMAVLPLLLGTVWLLGFMGILGVRFTLFNVPIFPALLGIGVDHGVYLTVALARARAHGNDRVTTVHDTGRAILAASTTTAVGFGSFWVAESGGLRDIGQAAVIGVLAAALATLLLLPPLDTLLHRRRPA